MNSFRLLLFAFLVAATCSCTAGKTKIRLASDYQTLPMPSFVTQDAARSGQLPKFAQIRVYELTKDCTLPNCPIVWDVVVPEDHSPTEFVYGGFPGFGSQTVISAQPLQPDRRYLLMTLPSEFGVQSGGGDFYFRVTPEGEVLAD